MYYAVTTAILVTMALALARALLGPTVYDRVLAVNMFGTKTALLLSVIAFLYGRPDFLDLALAYALINFIGVLAVLKFAQDYTLRHAWLHNSKPNQIANNGLKYQRLEPALRDRMRLAWNEPVVWPVAVLAAALGISLVPAVRTYRRRERQTAAPTRQ